MLLILTRKKKTFSFYKKALKYIFAQLFLKLFYFPTQTGAFFGRLKTIFFVLKLAEADRQVGLKKESGFEVFVTFERDNLIRIEKFIYPNLLGLPGSSPRSDYNEFQQVYAYSFEAYLAVSLYH